ncbi:cytochrome p450 2c19-like [Limosa lapponica baueri]|uniref:unspecific monooxygenase n=1 Tax=Limosa lapponica baueri TaxID=1758121 RepID=A0A2I0TQ72_LIMLA|nr:cytochrome p450 2c19-like [Limosa lapponica baueri]
MNSIFEMMNSHWGQLYQMFPNILDYLPGPHNQIFKEIDALKAFVSEEVKTHQASLDPSSPQDFIDCFLSKMQEEKDNPNSSFHMKNLITSTFDLFIAGTETTSTTIRYGLLLLLKYPKIQGSQSSHGLIIECIYPDSSPVRKGIGVTLLFPDLSHCDFA